MNLMIDLETLDTKNSSVVLSIGAVFFDNTGTKETFYAKLDVQDQLDLGRTVSASTLNWWMSQGDTAKDVFKEKGTSTNNSLALFVNFLTTYDLGKIKPWGNGSCFDISMIEDLLTSFNIEPSWKFWNIRDFRTFREYVYDGNDTKREGTHHNALDDAIFQAQVVIEGLNK